jgi:hypothetical protein
MDTNRIDIFWGAAFQPQETHCSEIAAGKPLPQKKPQATIRFLRVHQGCIFTDQAYSSAHVPSAAAGCAVFSDLLKPLRR